MHTEFLKSLKKLKRIAGRGRYSAYHRFVYERGSSRYRETLLGSVDRAPEVESRAKELIENGITVISEYFKGAELEKMQKEFAQIVATKTLSADADKIHWGRDQLERSYVFSKLAAESFLTNIARYYWGKPIYLAEMNGYRLLPWKQKIEDTETRWHHDTKMKQIKVFVLLADLPETGQCFHYYPKSHKQWRWNDEGAFYPESKLAGLGRSIKCFGKAGSVFIFDTNGIHRAGRLPEGPTRDFVVYTYTAGMFAEMIQLHPEVLSDDKIEKPLFATASGEQSAY